MQQITNHTPRLEPNALQFVLVNLLHELIADEPSALNFVSFVLHA